MIKREIDCRTRFILCDSENSRKSKWVQKEVEYIKEKQKQYEVIDLSLSDEKILEQIKEVRRDCNIFMSYSRNDSDLAEQIVNRLRKYEFNVFFDSDTLIGGTTFARQTILSG